MSNASAAAPSPSASPSAGFDWADPFRLEDQLSEDERLIFETARSYAEE
ncbi:acyl-CoA dehydrogenase, partial [Aurantimonas litoralis]|nr:acyl-CoA dehydrogenase [Aurantimonas litoralis]MCW7546259.1 acyl-CoA dehydrogenase [Aurantimonas litoralis]